MTLMGIRDFSRKVSGCIERVEETGKPLVLTRHGRPVAALVPVNSDVFEELVLTTPGFIADLDAAKRDLADGETSTLDEAMAELDAEDAADAAPAGAPIRARH
jgi:prevent-host-death family protein